MLELSASALLEGYLGCPSGGGFSLTGPQPILSHRAQLTLEFLPPLRPDCEEQLRCTPCSGVDGDLSEEWSEPFSTMVSPSGFCGVGERDRFRRMGEQAGVLRFELLAVLQGTWRGSGVERAGSQSQKAEARSQVPAQRPELGAGETRGG